MKIFLLLLLTINVAFGYLCDEFSSGNGYKGSCCTVRDFNALNDYAIEGINASNINKVKFIDFKYDKIPDKIFDANSRIMELNITAGNVQTIQKQAFMNAKKLNFLTLVKNGIEKLDKRAFSGAKFLYKLDLRQNVISYIHQAAFQELEFLSYVFLDYNKLEYIDSSVFEPLKRLFKLTLSNNRIKEIHPKMVYSCYKLDHLDLSRNNLTGTVVLNNKFNEICLINIGDNGITSFEVNAENSVPMRTLQLTVIARNNALTNVTVSNNYNLSSLNLYDNRIESIKFIVDGHSNISYINIGKNPLKTPLKHGFLRNLKYLNMTANSFSNISTASFSDLPLLQILDLSNVSLAEPLQLKTFEKLQNLEILDVSNTYLNESDLTNAIKRLLPNLKCFKYNNTGWECQVNDGNFWDEKPINVNVEFSSNLFPLWMKTAVVGTIGVLMAVCLFVVCVRKRDEHQVINNINIGSTTTELEML